MKFYNLHTHTATQQENSVELVNQYPQDFDATIPIYSIGIHPWFIVEERLASDLDILETKLQEPNCLAVGECGLDKRIAIPIELQQLVFEKQLVLAQKYNKPMVLHCVASFDELIATKKKLNITVPMIVHGFSKSEQLAKQLVSNGFYISFGKYLLLNPELESVFKSIPDDKIFLETDTVSENIAVVYELAATYKGISMLKMQELIKHNFHKVFFKEL
ncbi:TatD family hydrolase [Flavobacterium sp. XS2P14]|uniref:TatD family hydrolase n=1 Tax=Flavobacterium sp. XS2P14 TaxID=3401735 RepID=UPI003AAE11F7